MSFADKQKRHKGVCQMTGHALTLHNDPEAWDGLSLVMRYRLTGYERASLLLATSRSLPSDDVAHVLKAIEEREGIGMPLPPLLDHMDDATWWASHASVPERKAVLVAAYASLPAREQAEFLSYATRKDAA